MHISDINTDEVLIEFVANDVHSLNWHIVKHVSQILPTREGIHIHIGSSDGRADHTVHPSQFIMVK